MYEYIYIYVYGNPCFCKMSLKEVCRPSKDDSIFWAMLFLIDDNRKKNVQWKIPQNVLKIISISDFLKIHLPINQTLSSGKCRYSILYSYSFRYKWSSFISYKLDFQVVFHYTWRDSLMSFRGVLYIRVWRLCWQMRCITCIRNCTTDPYGWCKANV